MFTVEWLQSALDELTTLWIAADSSLRPRITQASAEIDQHLHSDPFGHSESRQGDVRILIAVPVAINFRVEADGHTVTVMHIWRIEKPGKS